MNEKSILFTILLLATLTWNTKADMLVMWTETNSGDVIASYSGTLDLFGYDVGRTFNPWTGLEFDGANNRFWGNMEAALDNGYFGNMNAFVDSGLLADSGSSGIQDEFAESFGFEAYEATGTAFLTVEPGYVSGSQINGEARFVNTTIAELFQGTSAFNTLVFDDGTNQIRFTAIPEPNVLAILVSAALFASARRRRCRYR